MVKLLSGVSEDESIFVGADLNGHVGKVPNGFEGGQGGHGYGKRNAEGEMLLEFAVAMDLVVGNTFFVKDDTKKITYQSGDSKSQIDYILVRRKDKSFLKNVTVINGEACITQHKLLLCNIELPGKLVKQRRKQEMFRTKAACTGSIRTPQTIRGGKTPSSVSGIPIPETTCSPPGEPRTVFSVCQPEVSPLWLASLLLLSGDVEENPGPPKTNQPSTSTKQTWTCQICTNKINHNQTSYLCHNTDHWVHKKCSETLQIDYHKDWTCKLHQNNQTATALQPPTTSQQIPAQA